MLQRLIEERHSVVLENKLSGELFKSLASLEKFLQLRSAYMNVCFEVLAEYSLGAATRSASDRAASDRMTQLGKYAADVSRFLKATLGEIAVLDIGKEKPESWDTFWSNLVAEATKLYEKKEIAPKSPADWNRRLNTITVSLGRQKVCELRALAKAKVEEGLLCTESDIDIDKLSKEKLAAMIAEADLQRERSGEKKLIEEWAALRDSVLTELSTGAASFPHADEITKGLSHALSAMAMDLTGDDGGSCSAGSGFAPIPTPARDACWKAIDHKPTLQINSMATKEADGPMARACHDTLKLFLCRAGPGGVSSATCEWIGRPETEAGLIRQGKANSTIGRPFPSGKHIDSQLTSCNRPLPRCRGDHLCGARASHHDALPLGRVWMRGHRRARLTVLQGPERRCQDQNTQPCVFPRRRGGPPTLEAALRRTGHGEQGGRCSRQQILRRCRPRLRRFEILRHALR